LYSQLKKSLYDGIEVLGKSAVLTASQTTRLGKGSSVTMQDKCAIRDPIIVRLTLSGFLKSLLQFLLVIQVFLPSFPPF